MTIASSDALGSKNGGPAWPATPYDGLKLTDGRSLGTVAGAELYREFDRLQIPGFNHSLGRLAAIDLYAKHLAAIGRTGADAAIAEYLQKNRS
jgi:hypothetical protein